MQRFHVPGEDGGGQREASVLLPASGPGVTAAVSVCSQAVSSGDEKEGLKHPGLMLKYSTYKNLAQLAAQREDLETAMEFYLEVRRWRARPPPSRPPRCS